MDTKRSINAKVEPKVKERYFGTRIKEAIAIVREAKRTGNYKLLWEKL